MALAVAAAFSLVMIISAEAQTCPPAGAQQHAVARVRYDDTTIVKASELLEISDPFMNPCAGVPYTNRWAAQVMWIVDESAAEFAEIGWRRRCTASGAIDFSINGVTHTPDSFLSSSEASHPVESHIRDWLSDRIMRASIIAGLFGANILSMNARSLSEANAQDSHGSNTSIELTTNENNATTSGDLFTIGIPLAFNGAHISELEPGVPVVLTPIPSEIPPTETPITPPTAEKPKSPEIDIPAGMLHYSNTIDPLNAPLPLAETINDASIKWVTASDGTVIAAEISSPDEEAPKVWALLSSLETALGEDKVNELLANEDIESTPELPDVERKFIDDFKLSELWGENKLVSADLMDKETEISAESDTFNSQVQDLLSNLSESSELELPPTIDIYPLANSHIEIPSDTKNLTFDIEIEPSEAEFLAHAFYVSENIEVPESGSRDDATRFYATRIISITIQNGTPFFSYFSETIENLSKPGVFYKISESIDLDASKGAHFKMILNQARDQVTVLSTNSEGGTAELETSLEVPFLVDYILPDGTTRPSNILHQSTFYDPPNFEPTDNVVIGASSVSFPGSADRVQDAITGSDKTWRDRLLRNLPHDNLKDMINHKNIIGITCHPMLDRIYLSNPTDCDTAGLSQHFSGYYETNIIEVLGSGVTSTDIGNEFWKTQMGARWFMNESINKVLRKEDKKMYRFFDDRMQDGRSKELRPISSATTGPEFIEVIQDALTGIDPDIHSFVSRGMINKYGRLDGGYAKAGFPDEILDKAYEKEKGTNHEVTIVLPEDSNMIILSKIDDLIVTLGKLQKNERASVGDVIINIDRPESMTEEIYRGKIATLNDSLNTLGIRLGFYNVDKNTIAYAHSMTARSDEDKDGLIMLANFRDAYFDDKDAFFIQNPSGIWDYSEGYEEFVRELLFSPSTPGKSTNKY